MKSREYRPFGQVNLFCNDGNPQDWPKRHLMLFKLCTNLNFDPTTAHEKEVQAKASNGQ